MLQTMQERNTPNTQLEEQYDLSDRIHSVLMAREYVDWDLKYSDVYLVVSYLGDEPTDYILIAFGKADFAHLKKKLFVIAASFFR